MATIAWAYMVELEDGLSKEQLTTLMNLVPEGVEVFPFSLDNGTTPMLANSMAIGFIDNDCFEEIPNVQEVLAEVCNDWENEQKDNTYTFLNEEGNEFDVIMLCDYETVK